MALSKSQRLDRLAARHSVSCWEQTMPQTMLRGVQGKGVQGQARISLSAKLQQVLHRLFAFTWKHYVNFN